MGTMKSLIGERFGRLTVIEFSHKTESRKYYWKCKCDCGVEKIIRADSLKNGSIQSCGCYNKESASKRWIGVRNDLTGKKFGRLTVIKPLRRSNRGYIWLCKCDCGNQHETYTNRLTSGAVSSCGCYNLELSRQRILEVSKRNVGQKHYNYNPNLTNKEREDKRDTSQNYKWRLSVYKRDNFKCKKCGVHNNELRAHHIKNYATNKNIRYDLDNGVTLCDKCHKQFHKIYGSKNNNLEQLKNFLRENTEVIL